MISPPKKMINVAHNAGPAKNVDLLITPHNYSALKNSTFRIVNSLFKTEENFSIEGHAD